MTKITIHPIPSLKDNYIWAIIDADSKKVTIVDPGEADPVIAFLGEQNLDLQSILITHHHWDHTGGVQQLKSLFEVPVYGSAHSPNIDITHRLNDGDKLPSQASSLNLQAISIPGHTLDHMAYYAPGTLFCGDTLFAAGCGRVFEGTFQQMYESLLRMAALPDDTGIYCAHEYTEKNLHFAVLVEPANTDIMERLERVKALRLKNLPTLPSILSEEKKTNPFLRCNSSQVIANTEKFSGQALATALEVFSSLRKWKDGF